MTSQNERTILLVEDDTDILCTLEEYLEGEGYRVQAVSNGLEALDVIKSKGAPNLILLDMRMPVLDGWQFAAEFRRAYGSAAPILVMSAAPDTGKRAEEVGATAWVNKPFELRDLMDKIKALTA